MNLIEGIDSQIIEELKEVWDSVGHDCFFNDRGKHDPAMVLGADVVRDTVFCQMDPRSNKRWGLLTYEQRAAHLIAAFPDGSEYGA